MGLSILQKQQKERVAHAFNQLTEPHKIVIRAIRESAKERRYRNLECTVDKILTLCDLSYKQILEVIKDLEKIGVGTSWIATKEDEGEGYFRMVYLNEVGSTLSRLCSNE